MSEVLYRKYRPQSFKDVVGQDHIVNVFTAAIEQGNLSHAYLFSGTRGTGKTSIARIVAHELGTSERDLYEIDAASNRGIDDIRALREEVQTLPFESDYKVYIIDEVHMLTKEAFNALLKTLEEPPAHVIFILATTELEKLPDTIRSRCQSFSFKTPSVSILRGVVERIAKAEGFTLDASAAEVIALSGDGSYRDTLGALQKVLSASKEKSIPSALVSEILGAPLLTNVQAIVKSVHEKNPEAGLAALSDMQERGVDMRMTLMLLLERMRAVMLLRSAPHLQATLKERFSEDEFKLLEGMASDKESHVHSQSLLTFLDCEQYLKSSPIKVLPLELALLSVTE